jgi:hypothetical protein
MDFSLLYLGFYGGNAVRTPDSHERTGPEVLEVAVQANSSRGTLESYGLCQAEALKPPHNINLQFELQ